jgi:hypothetical protein
MKVVRLIKMCLNETYGKLLSLTLREEYRLRVFENRVLRRIFGPKRDEVMGGTCTLLQE